MASKKEDFHIRISGSRNMKGVEEKNRFTLKDISLSNQHYSDMVRLENITADFLRNNNYYKLNADIGYNDLINNSMYREGLTRRTRIPYIKLYEFEPDMVFKFAQHLELISQTISQNLDAFGKILEGGLEGILKGIGGGDLDLFNEFSTIATGGDATKDLSNNLNLNLTDENYKENILVNPLRRYRSYFKGKFVNSYEIPYTDDIYMEANGTNGWDWIGAGDIDLHNNFMNMVWKTIANLGIINVNPVPVWKRSTDGDSEYYNITCEFNLNNNNLNSLLKNMYFLMTLVGGPLWVQNGSRFFPPNIYSVEIPGITHLLYATMVVNIESIGNKRKLPNDVDGLESNKTYKYIIKEENNTISLRNAYYPDAWKVTVGLKSLIPNNFNMYMNYLLNGSMDIDINTVWTNDEFDRLTEKYNLGGIV